MPEVLLQSSYPKLCKFLFLCFLFTTQLNSQEFLQVTVLGEEASPLPGVTVEGRTSSFQEITNDSGILNIPINLEDIFEFNYLGYKPVSISLDALKDANGKVSMELAAGLLSEIVVVGRTNAYQQEITQQVEMISAKEILQSGSQTTADAMSNHANVFIQKSQMGGGSPIIRGFEANKVLLVVDGVRMNNAIYRSGHLQNAITVSSFMLDQMEIIYGPGSLMYGSDALGGVVHFRTKDPKLTDQEKINFKGAIGARYASANQEKTAHARFEVANQKIGSLTSFSFSGFNDLRSGNKRKKFKDFGKLFDYVSHANGQDNVLKNNDPSVQIGTGYSQWDFLQKFIFQPNKNSKYIANIQWSNSTNIPRFDELSTRDNEGIPLFGDWYYGPQQRKLISLRGQYSNDRKLYDRAQWLVAYQDIDESRHTRNFNDYLLENRIEDLKAWNINVDFNKLLSSKWKLNLEYGLEYIHNRLASNAFSEDINTTIINQEISTRYPNDRNTWNTQGAYAILRKYSQDELIAIHAGLRFSAAQLFVSYQPGDGFEWPDFFYDGISSNNSQWTGSAGVKIKTTNKWQFNLLTSTAFRPPNIDDFAKVRVRGNNASVPNTSLIPEKSINAELTIQKRVGDKDRGANISSTLFITGLRDAVVRQDYVLPNGANTIIINNRIYNVQANVNADQAIIYGLSTQFEWDITKSYFFRGGINYVKGTTEQSGEKSPLAHIPPIYGRMAFGYNHSPWKISLFYLFNGNKPLAKYAAGSSDNEEFATPDGSLSWGILNFTSGYTLPRGLAINFGIDNIFDIHYRPFSSGVSASGRNIRFGVSQEF